MSIHFEYPPGATPLDPDELNGLIPGFYYDPRRTPIFSSKKIFSREKVEALKYKTNLRRGFCSATFTKECMEMSGSGAGQYRQSQKTIGIHAEQISTQVYSLMKDTVLWIELGSYPGKKSSLDFITALSSFILLRTVMEDLLVCIRNF